MTALPVSGACSRAYTSSITGERCPVCRMIACASAPCPEGLGDEPGPQRMPAQQRDLRGGEPGLLRRGAGSSRSPRARSSPPSPMAPVLCTVGNNARPGIRRVREPGGAAARAAPPAPRPAPAPLPHRWCSCAACRRSTRITARRCRRRVGGVARRAAPPATARTRTAGRSPGPARTAAPSPDRGPPGRSCEDRNRTCSPSAGCRVTSARVRATSSDRRCAPANPISSNAMSRRAATPAGHSVTRVDRSKHQGPQMSSSSSGDRRTGGMARIRRTPDSARRTTSDPPGGGEPGGGVELVDRGHPPGQRGRGVPPLPHPGLLRGRLRHVVRDHQRRGRQRGEPPLRRPGGEPRPVRPVRLLRVRPRSRRPPRPAPRPGPARGTCGPADPPLSADSVSRAAVSSASRTSRSLGNTGGTCGAADDGGDACGIQRRRRRRGTASGTVSVTVHLPPNRCCSRSSARRTDSRPERRGVSERSCPESPDLGRVTYIGCAVTADNGTLCEPKDCE